MYLNYTVPHAELRVPADSVDPFRGRFPEEPFANQTADEKPAGARWDVPSLGYRSQPTPRAAFAGMITRMDPTSAGWSISSHPDSIAARS